MARDARVIAFADFDRGLEWCEDQLLSAAGSTVQDGQTLYGWQGPAFSDPAMGAALRGYFEPANAAEGEFLMRQGEQSDDLLFIESGRVAVQLEIGEGRSVRLRAFGPGSVVGEIAMYLGIPRSASVVADRPTVAYRLSARSLERMKKEHPELVAEFHQYMARLLAERLSDANKLVRSLLD
jgi:SulP family sulfate permease